MTRSGPNPVLAPIRRWVLYSRTNLTLSMAGVTAVLVLAGAAFGEDPTPRQVPGPGPATTEQTSGAEGISYELDEVSESVVVSKTAVWTAASAPATAMAYAHTFVDTALSDTEWVRALGRYTATMPGESTVAARPGTPVVITGPTTSTLVSGAAGVPSVRVRVPTQAGDLAISVVVEQLPDGTQRWVVDTPLPTLDLAAVAKNALQPTTSRPAPPTPTESTTPRPTTTTTSSAPPTTTSPATVDLDEPAPAPSRPADPIPVPGSIPIPDLDTPIPGEL